MRDFNYWVGTSTVLQLYQELINLKFIQLETVSIEDRIRLLHNELMSRGEGHIIEISDSEAKNKFVDRYYV